MALPENWSEYLLEHPLPVRRAVHQGMCRELLDESPDLPRLVGWLRRDPAAASMVLGAAAQGQRHRQRGAPHNLEHALSLLGTNWARKRLPELPILENHLTDPDQLAGYLAASSRAIRAARLTETWLIERRETGIEMVMVAALLHNLVELALWRDAPQLAREALGEARQRLVAFIREQEANEDLAQCFGLGHSFEAVLAREGVDLERLEAALTERYYLPVMLLADEVSIPVLGAHHQAILVLARRLAFASEFGWYTPIIRKLNAQVAEYLHASPHAAWRVTLRKSIRDAREFADIPLYHPGHMLVEHSDDRSLIWPLPADYGLAPGDNDCHAARPRPAPTSPTSPGRKLGDRIRTLSGMPDVAEIALYAPPASGQASRNFHWSRADACLPQAIVLADNPLLTRLISRLEVLGVDETNGERLSPYLDETLRDLATQGLAIAPLTIDGELIAILLCRGGLEHQAEIIALLEAGSAGEPAE